MLSSPSSLAFPPVDSPSLHHAGGLKRPVAKPAGIVALNAEAAVAADLKARCTPASQVISWLGGTTGAGLKCMCRQYPRPPSFSPLLHYLQARLRRLPWRPMLSEAEARRGVAYAGSGAPLRRLAAKLLAGQAVKIVTIGGSVTQGGGMLGVSLRPGCYTEVASARHADEAHAALLHSGCPAPCRITCWSCFGI